MGEKRFVRNIVGDIYDSEKNKWFEEDWKGKPVGYDDDLIVFLNEQQATISRLGEENEKLRQTIKEYEDYKQRLQKSINTLKEMYNDE